MFLVPCSFALLISLSYFPPLNPPEKHIALVCNPTRENEKALKLTNSISLLLTGMNIRHDIFIDKWPVTWNSITEAWIFGGDGTLNWFINQYPDFKLPISIFPGGTGNDFHWMLYNELEPEKQVDLILEAKAQPVDAGTCNGQLFMNGVGIGFDGAIVRDMLGKKKLAGTASYLLSILKHIAAYKEKPCLIRMPAETITQDCFLISVANAKRYGGGFNVAPRASITDGLLDLNVVGKISHINRMRFLPVIEKGQHLGLPFVHYAQLNKVSITSPAVLHCHKDGEYYHENNFEIEILPKRFSFLY